MRVLAAIVVPPHLSVSGGARAGEQLSAAMAPYCDVTVASMLNKGSEEAEGLSPVKPKRIEVKSDLPPILPWNRLPNKFSTLFYRSNLPEIIRTGGWDLVHIHNPTPALEMQRVACQCRSSGIPYVVHTHGFNEIANGRRIYDFGLAKKAAWLMLAERPLSEVLRHADGVFALSSADFDIVRNMGFKGDVLTVVPNGVPQPAPASAAADAEALVKLGIPHRTKDGPITCFFLANHTPNKGLPILLEAFARLDIPLNLIVGGERRADIDYDTARAKCHPDQRIIITGRLTDGDIAAIFRNSDLFVFPTLADTFPLVVLEAMVHGVPVLASMVGGIPHQIEGGCGQLVEPGNPDSLAAALKDLAANRDQLNAMGERAKARAAATYTWDAAARTALAAYGRILKKPVVLDDVALKETV